MPSDSNSGASGCPRCPAGECPVINTTPDCPEPSLERVTAAQRAIANVLAESNQGDGWFGMVASDLIEELGKPAHGAHRPTAAKWAVQRLIQQEMLTAHACVQFDSPMPTLNVCRRRYNEQTGMFYYEQPAEQPPIYYSYGSNPAPFNTFQVRAEKTLWTWWRTVDAPAQASSPFQSGNNEDPRPPQLEQTYLSSELCKELGGISTATLNKYAKQAEVPTPGQGKRDHRYSAVERIAILEAIVRSGSSALVKAARSRLADMPSKSS